VTPPPYPTSYGAFQNVSLLLDGKGGEDVSSQRKIAFIILRVAVKGNLIDISMIECDECMHDPLAYGCAFAVAKLDDDLIRLRRTQCRSPFMQYLEFLYLRHLLY
jgi:hypothetical protein